ncbi:acyl-CoA thioesterase [Bacillus marinisedimentorum]|uniref:acyl-CoA thioesterase n=1 Tax=Bacillus marinisedimentorum TaxID=1821260 RepID=UPI0008729916|nr:thioesterase family protein [Bacillus marinisedimentorum]
MSLPDYIKPPLEEWLNMFHFFSTVKVRVCETDHFGHVNNTSYFPYFEQGRVDYLEEVNLYESDLSVMVGDAYCRYHRQALARQELSIGVRTARIGSKSFTLEYAIQRSNDKELISSGWTTMILIDKHTKKSVMVPEELRTAIDELDHR